MGTATGVMRSRPALTLAGGLLVALLSWRIAVIAPGAGLDASWYAGLSMAVDQGLHFGTELVFSYGPLGFLQSGLAWFRDYAALAFLYSGGLWLALCVGLVWALRRRLPLLLSLLGALAVATLLVLFEYNLLIAVFGCVWLLERERPQRQVDAFVVVAAAYGAVSALVKLSSGPLSCVLFAVALLGARVGRLRVAAYLVLLAACLLVLWLATGQSLADIPAFAERTLQVSSGYSSAMLRKTTVAEWKVTAAVVAGAAVSIGVAAAAALAGYRDRRARWAGTLIAALAAFAIFKEGVVRTDLAHITLLFANVCVLYLAFGLSGRHWRPALAVVLAVGLLTIPVRPPGETTALKIPDNLRLAWNQTRDLLSPDRRQAEVDSGRAALQALYALDPAALAALQGHTVAVEPWEVAVAWAYELDWQPLPVFQNYSAYTAELDRMNAAAVEDPDGPERLLRENQALVFPEFPGPDLDGRFPGWDPPEQARAVLCNFAPLDTEERWQVLGRVPDRCGPPRAAGTVTAAEGEAVPVPAPGPEEVVFARIGGAGVSGFERVTTTLLHAAVRRAVLDGAGSYRLVPETAEDGLLLRGSPGVAGPPPFAGLTIPEAETIAVEGAPGDLTFSFYRMRVRPAAVAPP